MEVTVNRKKLIQARYEKGFGIKELAKKSNVAQMTIVNIEKGKCQPTPCSLRKICTILDIPVSEILILRG